MIVKFHLSFNSFIFFLKLVYFFLFPWHSLESWMILESLLICIDESGGGQQGFCEVLLFLRVCFTSTVTVATLHSLFGRIIVVNWTWTNHWKETWIDHLEIENIVVHIFKQLLNSVSHILENVESLINAYNLSINLTSNIL